MMEHPDPFDDTVLVFAQLECDSCFCIIHQVPDNPDASTAEVGDYGKKLGWVCYWDDEDDFPTVFCPKCAKELGHTDV